MSTYGQYGRAGRQAKEAQKVKRTYYPGFANMAASASVGTWLRFLGGKRAPIPAHALAAGLLRRRHVRLGAIRRAQGCLDQDERRHGRRALRPGRELGVVP